MGTKQKDFKWSMTGKIYGFRPNGLMEYMPPYISWNNAEWKAP